MDPVWKRILPEELRKAREDVAFWTSSLEGIPKRRTRIATRYKVDPQGRHALRLLDQDAKQWTANLEHAKDRVAALEQAVAALEHLEVHPVATTGATP